VTARTLQKSPTPPTISTAVAGLIQRLTAIPAGSHHILSCYVRLKPRDRTRASYLITEFKDRVKTLRADPMVLALARDERLAVERDLNQILSYLAIRATCRILPGWPSSPARNWACSRQWP